MSGLPEKREGRNPPCMGGTQACRDHRRRDSVNPSHSDYPKKALYALRLVLFHPGTMVPGEIPLTLMENTDIIAHFLKIRVFTGKKRCSLLCLYKAGDKRG